MTRQNIYRFSLYIFSIYIICMDKLPCVCVGRAVPLPPPGAAADFTMSTTISILVVMFLYINCQTFIPFRHFILYFFQNNLRECRIIFVLFIQLLVLSLLIAILFQWVKDLVKQVIFSCPLFCVDQVRSNVLVVFKVAVCPHWT